MYPYETMDLSFLGTTAAAAGPGRGRVTAADPGAAIADTGAAPPPPGLLDEQKHNLAEVLLVVVCVNHVFFPIPVCQSVNRSS